MVKMVKGLATGGERVRMIGVDEIAAGPYRVRGEGGADGGYDPALIGLKDSICRHGILVPLTVRAAGGRGYTLISGGRRLRAARELGFAEVPCLILPADERLCAEFELIESMQRRELDPFEQAEAILRLIDAVGLTREEAARQLSCSVGCISNKLRLLRLGPEERDAVRKGGLTERHVRAALRIPGAAARLAALREMAARGMSVAAAEEYVEELTAGSAFAGVPPRKRSRQMKDVTILVNTLERAVRTLRSAGVDARLERRDGESSAEFLVTVPVGKDDRCFT